MNLQDVRAVIDSAKVRDGGMLEEFIRGTAPSATDAEISEAAEVAVEVVESVPLLFARAVQVAEERDMEVVVMPLLEHAANYFVNPIDLIPEMTKGMAGLLDDTYLALRVLETLNRGTEHLFEGDLEHPLRFLRRLVGTKISRKLDAVSMLALEDVSSQVGHAFAQIGRS